MKKILFFLAVSLFFTNLTAQEEVRLTPTEKVYGLSKIWSEARYNYVYYDRLGFDWDSLYRATIPAVLATENLMGYYDELIRFTVRLEDGHTGVNLPNALADKYQRKVPLHFDRIGDHVYIKAVGHQSITDAGVRMGDEILAVNGEPVLEYAVHHIAPRVMSSTPHWRQAVIYDKGALTQGAREEMLELKIKHRDGSVRDHSFSREWDWQEGFNQTPEHFAFEVLEGNIGHLILTRFWGDDFGELFSEAYRAIRETDGLIIDIRYNDGGNTNFAYHILRRLAREPFVGSAWSTRVYKPAFASWGYPEEWYTEAPGEIEPSKNPYTAPVVVLIDHETFSAAEDFAVAFRNMDRGVMIGRPTAGSTGNPIFFELPGGAWAKICSKKDTYPDGTEFVGIGVLPDITVEPTLESLVDGKDLYVEKAIEVIRSASAQKK